MTPTQAKIKALKTMWGWATNHSEIIKENGGLSDVLYQDVRMGRYTQTEAKKIQKEFHEEGKNIVKRLAELTEKDLQEKTLLSIKLERKKSLKGLTTREEKIYCKLNSEITGLPEKLFTKDFNDKLDNVLQKTDELIKAVNKSNKAKKK